MIFRSEKGSALIIVIIICLMTVVLGTGLMTVSNANAKQVQRNEDKTQAEYYAKSGVDIAVKSLAEKLQNPDINYDTAKIPNDFFNQDFYGGIGSSFNQQLTNESTIRYKILSKAITNDEGNVTDYEFTISSTGYVRRGAGQQDFVSSSLIYRNLKSSSFITYLQTHGDNPVTVPNEEVPRLDKVFAVGVNNLSGKAIELTGSSSILGNTGVNSIIANSVSFSSSTSIKDGDLLIGPGGNPQMVVFSPKNGGPYIPNGSIKNLNAVQNYSLPQFPAFPDLPSRKSINAGYYPIPDGGFRITEDGQYSSINVTNQLTIDVGNEDRIIRTDSLSVTGNAQININRTGTGRLIFYVGNTFTLSGSSSINSSGDYNSLIMYYDGNEAIDLDGNTKFAGCVFASHANFIISGSGGITGHIVTGGNSVDVTGDASANVRAIYAPNASLSITGSSKIKGAVVANDIRVIGNARIYYSNAMDGSFFDNLTWDSTSTPTPETGTDSSSWRNIGIWEKS